MFYDKQFTTATTHKTFQHYYNEKCTYNTHGNFLYAPKIWNCLNFIQTRRLIFFCLIKLIFIKVRCLTNVNVSLEANLEGQGKLYMLFTKVAHQSANFQTCHCLH